MCHTPNFSSSLLKKKRLVLIFMLALWKLPTSFATPFKSQSMVSTWQRCNKSFHRPGANTTAPCFICFCPRTAWDAEYLEHCFAKKWNWENLLPLCYISDINIVLYSTAISVVAFSCCAKICWTFHMDFKYSLLENIECWWWCLTMRYNSEYTSVPLQANM